MDLNLTTGFMLVHLGFFVAFVFNSSGSLSNPKVMYVSESTVSRLAPRFRKHLGLTFLIECTMIESISSFDDVFFQFPFFQPDRIL